MASAEVPATITFYIRKKSGPYAGQTFKVFSGSEAALGGPCPDGVLTRSPDMWLNVPVYGKVKANVDDELLVGIKTVANVTLDASDAIWNIPIMSDSGATVLQNNSTDFDILALADTAYVAATETIGAIHRFKEPAFFGGGKICVALQNNA